MEHLYIKTFGEFSFQLGDRRVSDSDNRSRKVWLLLAYLVCHRGRVIPRKELIDVLWGDATNENPESALKTTLHRVRTLLNQLSPAIGHDLILYQNRGYLWNAEIPLVVDASRFDELCRTSRSDPAAWLSAATEALELYHGNFLGNLSSETWLLPVTTYYHNTYIQLILDTIPLLSEAGRHEEAVSICRNALLVEPYHEPLHCLLMQSLLHMGDIKGVTAAYENLQQQMFSEMGIRPGEEALAIYRAATQTLRPALMQADQVIELLQESEVRPGALQCDLDYFKVLCHAESRAIARSGKAAHLVLMSVNGSKTHPLSKKSTERAMEQLGDQICGNLRRNDSFTQCSISQYLILLPEANYENSCMVAQRVITAFFRRHPHSAAQIQFVVQPLEAAVR